MLILRAMNPFHIMIIDDHPGIRALIRELIAECVDAHGFSTEISEHDSGPSALQAVSAVAPDMVTLDLRMSGTDGTYYLRRLRQQATHAVIIVVTSLQGESVARHAMLAGGDGLVHKDDLTSLQALVREHLLSVRLT
jgi:CheY-like chemotaxis protein